MVAIGVTAVLTNKEEKKESANFPIAGTLYAWPIETTIIPPQPPGLYGDGYVRFHPSQPGYKSDYRLIYDGNHQEPKNEAGLPHLQQLTSRFSKPEEHSIHETPVGPVVCNRKLVQVGGRFPCGLSFVHRGARWQLHFGANKVLNSEALYHDALARLDALRIR